ncbi:MAG: rhodanese-like domain-containing protein [Chromatiales bacterium]|jgi:rhodanese-related sulfurtransferase
MVTAIRIIWLLALGLALGPSAHAQDDEFPGRALFIGVNPIEVEELYANLGDVHVVDVRSKYEYETLHIKGAHHVALYDSDFVDQLRALQREEDKPLIFYCNGRKCYKSYKADEKARNAGLKDTRVFDPGIFEWAEAHPEAAVLLGESPVPPGSLISSNSLESHMLAPTEFIERVEDQSLVLDIRGPLQRGLVGVFILDTNISMDDKAKLLEFIGRVKKAKKPLFVYDMTGKQVRWFQYFLEQQKVPEYYFMKGGMKAYFEEVIRG